MGKESTQHKLDRVRAPRVHITYDVETGGAIQMKELPFVMGVMSDLSGKPDPDNPLPKFKDRKFVEIDRDNFNSVLKSMKPRLAFKPDNTLKNDGSKIGVELRFNSMDDFEPEQVVKKVPALEKLLKTRAQLFELLAKTDGNDNLTDKLQEILSNKETIQQLAKDAGIEAPSGEGDESSEATKEE